MGKNIIFIFFLILGHPTVPPPSSPISINSQAFSVPPPIVRNNSPSQVLSSTPFRGRQISTNITRAPFSPLGARTRLQTKHISYVQKRINKKAGYHTYEDMESGSEIDFGMFVPSEKQRTYKRRSDSEAIGIY